MLYLSLLETEAEKAKTEQIYRHYFKLMKYIALQILEKESLAEDAAHDAMLRLMDHLDCIKEVESRDAKAFVAIVTENAAKDLLRRERYRAAEDITEYFNRLSGQTSVERSVYVNELLERIKALPATLRDPLELSLYYGMESGEIAKLLKISKWAVRKRIERARAALTNEEEVQEFEA